MIGLALLPHKATLTPVTGHDGFKETHGAAVPIRARIEERTKAVTDRHGKTVVASAFVFLPAAAEVRPGDVLTWRGREYEATQGETLVDFAGRPFHHEWWFTEK